MEKEIGVRPWLREGGKEGGRKGGREGCMKGEVNWSYVLTCPLPTPAGATPGGGGATWPLMLVATHWVNWSKGPTYE